MFAFTQRSSDASWPWPHVYLKQMWPFFLFFNRQNTTMVLTSSCVMWFIQCMREREANKFIFDLLFISNTRTAIYIVMTCLIISPSILTSFSTFFLYRLWECLAHRLRKSVLSIKFSSVYYSTLSIYQKTLAKQLCILNVNFLTLTYQLHNSTKHP